MNNSAQGISPQPTPDSRTELLPCPFCGKTPLSFPSGDGTGVMIECITERCVGPHISYYGEGVAAKIWNTRAPLGDGE